VGDKKFKAFNFNISIPFTVYVYVHLPFSHFLLARDVASLFHAKTPCHNYDTSKRSCDAHFSHAVLGRPAYCTFDYNAYTDFFAQETGSYKYIQFASY